MRNPKNKSDLHNEVVPKVMKAMLQPLREGGDTAEVLVIAESALFGILLLNEEGGGSPEATDVLFRHVKERLAEARVERSMARMQGRMN